MQADVGAGRLVAALAELNTMHRDDALTPEERAQVEALAHALYQVGSHLIVYGSLRPGEPNHAQIAALRGTWRDGWVTGALTQLGWGAAHGYPAIRLRPHGERVPAKLLASEDLVRHWARLDAFEGADYRRVLAPFWTDKGLEAVGYIYELRNDED